MSEHRNVHRAAAITVELDGGDTADLQTVIDGLGGGGVPAHTHPAAEISNATTVGRSVLTAADAVAARTAIGAGTSSIALGTTSTTAALGNHTHTGGLMAGTAAAVADSTATDVAGAVASHNALLAALRTRGVIT